jgi:phosphoenolpyruvate carboxykinase (ATP)
VNTGWSGGPSGAAPRMKLAYTRALLRAALGGTLARVPFAPDPVFAVLVPQSCPGVPAEILRPRAAWSNPAAYDAQAQRLAGLFCSNFAAYAAQVPDAVRQAGPS